MKSIPFRFIAGNLHPDHDTIANFRQKFLPQIKDLFVQVLLIAERAGVLKLGNISLDGGNEDGIKHCAMNILFSLSHIGYTIPPQADAGWLGEVGPGPSYLDPGSGGPENDFTNRNTTFLAWNCMHLARMLKDHGGIPAHGNQPEAWDAGCQSDFNNPEHKV